MSLYIFLFPPLGASITSQTLNFAQNLRINVLRKEINRSDGDLLVEVADFLKKEAHREDFDGRNQDEI